MKDLPDHILGALGPGEDVIWSGPTAPKRIHDIFLAVAITLVFACLWLGWSTASPLSAFAPTVAKIVLTGLAVPPFGFAALLLIDRILTGETIVTNQRLLFFRGAKKLMAKDSFPIDFNRACRVSRHGDKADLDVPTGALDSSSPKYYSIGKLDTDVANGLAETIDALGPKASELAMDDSR